MASVNRATVLGNLGRDPETRYMPDGTAVTNLSVATTHSWKDKATGDKKEETEWHRVVLYGRVAEIAGEYLTKGAAVYIEGRIRTREWEKDGQRRFTTEIVADQMQMLGKRESNADQASAAEPKSEPAKKEVAPPPGAKRKGTGQPAFDDMEDDIPF